MDTCAAHKAEQHKVEWESKRRAEEVKELQKVMLPWQLVTCTTAFLHEILGCTNAASQWHTGGICILQALSDAHTYLFEERDRLLKLQSENDELRLQEVEDRKRIRHLLAMHGPLEQEITYNRDGKPNIVTVYPRHGQENMPKKANQVEASERVMRTVYLPAANADNLMLKVESLQAQLDEQVCDSNRHRALYLFVRLSL